MSSFPQHEKIKWLALEARQEILLKSPSLKNGTCPATRAGLKALTNPKLHKSRGTTACVAGAGTAPLARTQHLGCPFKSVCQGGAFKVISLTIHPFYVKQRQDPAMGSPISRE